MTKKHFLLSLVSLLSLALSSTAQQQYDLSFEPNAINNYTVDQNYSSYYGHGGTMGAYYNIVSDDGYVIRHNGGGGYSASGVERLCYITNFYPGNTYATNSSFSIKSDYQFIPTSLWVAVAVGTSPVLATASNSLIVTVKGKLAGAEVFSVTKNSATSAFALDWNAFPADGYSEITFNAAENKVDEVEVILGGDITVAKVDFMHLVTSTEKSLPVTFGNVNASLSNNTLDVNWSTETETSNDHFEIEASADGKTFTKIGEAKSKAVNGDSDIALHYEFSSSASGIALGISLGFLALGSVGFSRRKKTLATLAIVIGLGVGVVGCQKSDASGIDFENLFVRITQVDKDGTKSYSKIVKAVRK